MMPVELIRRYFVKSVMNMQNTILILVFIKVHYHCFELLLEVARQRKLQWFDRTTRRPGLLAHDVMHGLMEGARKPTRT